MIHEHDWPEEIPIVYSVPFDDETDYIYRASICTCGTINGWWEERKR